MAGNSGFWYQDNEIEFKGVTSKPSNTGQTLSFETTIDIEGQPINNKICPIIDLKIGHNWTEHQINYTLSNYRVYVGNKLNKSMFVFDAGVNYHTDKDAVYELDTKYGMVTMKEPNEKIFHSLREACRVMGLNEGNAWKVVSDKYPYNSSVEGWTIEQLNE